MWMVYLITMKITGGNKGGNITVELAGGLGNQLFQYVAGLCIAKRGNFNLMVDVRYAQYVHSEFDLTSFELPGEFRTNRSLLTNRMTKLLRRIFDGLNTRGMLKPINKLIQKRIFFEDSASQYEVFDKIESKMRITGFFSNKYFLEDLQSRGLLQELNLRNPSDWYISMEQKALKVQPIVCHIRRGDFVSEADTYGLLSESFYMDSLAKLPMEYAEREIWVFCDQSELIDGWNLWKDFNVFFVREIDSEKKDPAEFLKLMSMASAIVIANSTFSYFAAALSSTVQLVYCPSPPMRGRDIDTKSIYFDSWISVSSSWE